MRYLHGIASLVSCYQGEDFKFGEYSDANWSGGPNESRYEA